MPSPSSRHRRAPLRRAFRVAKVLGTATGLLASRRIVVGEFVNAAYALDDFGAAFEPAVSRRDAVKVRLCAWLGP